MIKTATNDASKKNLSSIVFLVKVKVPGNGALREWSGLFTGDASANNIFKDWDCKPKELDLIKSMIHQIRPYCTVLYLVWANRSNPAVGHHGSNHNNCM
jgi:hypothetical protein